jgi:hypothetical protein
MSDNYSPSRLAMLPFHDAPVKGISYNKESHNLILNIEEYYCAENPGMPACFLFLGVDIIETYGVTSVDQVPESAGLVHLESKQIGTNYFQADIAMTAMERSGETLRDYYIEVRFGYVNCEGCPVDVSPA